MKSIMIILCYNNQNKIENAKVIILFYYSACSVRCAGALSTRRTIDFSFW